MNTAVKGYELEAGDKSLEVIEENGEEWCARRPAAAWNSRPNAPEGRRGDLYPAELRARLTRITHLDVIPA